MTHIFVKHSNKKPLVIITSAFDEYALESYELDVCDYLLKPFRFDRFLKAANKAFELYHLKNSLNTPSAIAEHPVEETQHQLFIKSDKRLIQIDLNDILYLESYGNYVKIWQESACHLTPRTLSSFEKQLPKPDFFRIHKSYIVNKKYIEYVEGNMVMLKNSIRLPLGKNQRQGFMQFIS